MQCGPGSIPRLGVICGFSTLLREVFLRVLRFSLLLKNQNSICVNLLVSEPRLRVPSNKLILSITVADWLHAVLAYPVGVIANASQSSRGLSGIACTWYGFITVFLTQNARDLWGEKAFPTQEAIQSQKKVARMAFIMSICFLFAWTPYAAVSLYAFLWKPKRMTPYVSIIPAMFAKTSVCFNPVTYFSLLKTFRESLRKTMQPVCGIFMSTGNPTNIEMKNSIYSSLENKNDDKL
ncbi:melanopsin-B-like [Montipora capricornis]|uniref:melanopsin-B-like n=1 Tax=Montipora foliosa TaxID=591990 RepID=UPI0035F1389F